MATNRAYLAGDIPILGPIGVAVTGISNSPVAAIGSDFLRHGILFHNPSAATVLRIAPTGAALAAGVGGIAINPYSFFELYDSGGGENGDGEGLVRVNCGWQVVADTAGSFGLTIWNFTDNNQAVPAPLPISYQNLDVDIASPTLSPVSGLTTVSASIMAANQNRRGVLFHNPGTKIKAIAPANLAASLVAGSILLLPKSQKQINAFGKVRINCGFNALTADNSDGTLTPLEFV